VSTHLDLAFFLPRMDVAAAVADSSTGEPSVESVRWSQK
jgi:hypothetical protein